MSLAPRRWAAELLHFWFHELRPEDWWGGSDTIDAICTGRFQHELEALSAMSHASFTGDSRTALAAVLLFDQMPRNIYRETPRAFAFDPLARAITIRALDRAYDRTFPPRHAQFLAMPLMHSEDIADQLRSLAVFRRINAGRNLGFARSHYRMIARFGHFPHRNDVLGRHSTAKEKCAVAAGNAW